jgi:hypothetical protein
LLREEFNMRIPYISLIAAGAVALGGCAYGGLGYGNGQSVGVGTSYGYGSPYYGGYYGGYGGYGGYYSPYSSPFGWYGDYYYPGTGYYVYDSYRRPYVWSDAQRRYWSSRQSRATVSGARVATTSPNWSSFDRRTASAVQRQRVQKERAEARAERAAQRAERRKDRRGDDDDD